MRRIIALFAILLMLQPVFATINIVTESDKFTLRAGSIEKIALPVFSDVDDTIVLTLDAPSWVALSDIQIPIKSFQTVNVNLSLSPSPVTTEGRYKITLIADSLSTDSSFKWDFFVNVIKESGVRADKILVKGDFLSDSNVTIETYLHNYADVSISDTEINIRISSPTKEVLNIKKFIEKINPGETKVLIQVMHLPEIAESGTYFIDVDYAFDGKSRHESQQFVVPKKPVFRQRVDEFSIIIGTGKHVFIINIGNVPGEYTYSDDVNLFFYGDEPSRREGNRAVWSMIIGSGEMKEIKYETNYSILLLIIILAAIVFWTMSHKKKIFYIKKYVIKNTKIEEGSELRIGISIENTTGRELSDVVIRDFVPSAFKVLSASSNGTVKKTSLGTQIKWNLGKMAKNEQFVFTYDIKALLGVSGVLALPRVMAEHITHKGKIEIKSIPATIGELEQKMKEE
ncbi:MAG: hypothetical protein J4473_02265 [Candidatus Aenigmarchaeota archaeon]|nr:hypothetical protein [Candidatus Aenigmarchaeota archaeon]